MLFLMGEFRMDGYRMMGMIHGKAWRPSIQQPIETHQESCKKENNALSEWMIYGN